MPSRRFAALLGCAFLSFAAPGLVMPVIGAPAAGELPPGVKLPAQPAATKAKPAAKAAKKPARKKKQSAKSRKTKLKSGRGAASSSPLDFVDKNQLATDYLADVKSKSPLDILASYKETLRDGDLETAAVLLRLAASGTPTRETVTVVNDLLGLSLNTEDTEILVGLSAGARASAYDLAGTTGATVSAAASSAAGNRVEAAHAAAESAPKASRLDALAAYKAAVTQERPDTAALALTGALGRALDAEAVGKANALLGVTGIMPDSSILAQAPTAL